MADDDSKREAPKGIPVTRKQVDLRVGNLVKQGKSTFRIVRVVDFEKLVADDVATGQSVILRVTEVEPHNDENVASGQDIDAILDEDWQIANQRYRAIEPLLNLSVIGRVIVKQQALAAGVNSATIYRWLRRYKSVSDLSSLIPLKRGWKTLNFRISNQAESVVQDVIRDTYLTPQRPTDQKAIVEVQRRCLSLGIKAPSPGTIRARLAAIPERDFLRGRGFRERAKNKFVPVPGSFPGADYPLAVIQIDHTPVDIMLVDDVHRKSIGRPFITLAMDVHSRMITGYYLSFDPPSETSVAMCVAHSILPKQEWLLLHKVDADWPVWGVPKKIYVDNGADFRSDNFQRSCEMYGINLEFRPVKRPNYGGHIERMLGTILREIHALPGTTFSAVKHREGYDSEKNAVMTTSEFEAWLVGLICKVYHQRVHSSIGMSPIRKWEIGILGDGDTPGIGVPPRPAGNSTVLMDFLPAFSRTIQAFGVTIDGVTYYAESLRHWINETEPGSSKKREFIFRRDPRDIRVVWFYDPVLEEYFQIPTADQSIPSVSIWEYQQAKEKLKREGEKSAKPHQVLQSLTELREQVEESKEKTKKARRQAQRRKEHAKKISPTNPLQVAGPLPVAPSAQAGGLIDGDVEPFGEIE